jgi:hypothetical protein
LQNIGEHAINRTDEDERDLSGNMEDSVLGAFRRRRSFESQDADANLSTSVPTHQNPEPKTVRTGNLNLLSSKFEVFHIILKRLKRAVDLIINLNYLESGLRHLREFSFNGRRTNKGLQIHRQEGLVQMDYHDIYWNNHCCDCLLH